MAVGRRGEKETPKSAQMQIIRMRLAFKALEGGRD